MNTQKGGMETPVAPKLLRFKGKLYKYYAPYLYKLKRLQAQFDLIRWKFDSSNIDSLAHAYWNQFLAKKYLQEISNDGGTAYNGKPKKRESDKAFILGCGQSINKIDNEQWDYIGQHFSIGVNTFYVHNFTPNAYFCEFCDNDIFIEQIYAKLLNNAERSKADIFLSAYFVVIESTRYVTPKVNKPMFYSADRIRISDRNLLFKLLKLYYKPENVNVRLCHQVSNMDVAINYSVANGYKDIYLVGVDLNDHGYFWDEGESKDYQMAKEFIKSSWQEKKFKVEKGGVHSTASSQQGEALGRLNIVDYLVELQARILSPMGVNLHITNPNSLLAGKLQVTTISSLLKG